MQRYYKKSNNKAYVILNTINQALLSINSFNVKVYFTYL